MTEKQISDFSYQQLSQRGAGNFFEYLLAYRQTVIPDYVNSNRIGGAKLNGHFIAGFIPLTGDIYNDRQEYTSSTFHRIEHYVFRGTNPIDNEALPPMVLFDRLVDDQIGILNEAKELTSSSYLFRSTWASLKALYQSFAQQGPERKVLVPLVKKQDRAEIDRVTHFVANNGISPIAHIQVLVSEREDEPLHLESQWKSELPKLPGPRRGELGRLYIFSPRETESRAHNSVRYWKDIDDQADYLRMDLFRRAFAWSNQDAHLDSLSFQVNTSVFAKLKRIGVPFEFARVIDVATAFNGEVIPEHIIIFDRKGLRKAEDSLLRASLKIQLDKFLAQPTLSAAKVVLRFKHNEIRAVLSSGLFGNKAETLARFEQSEESPASKFVHLFSRDLISSSDFDELTQLHALNPGHSQNEARSKSLPALSSLELSPNDISREVFEWPPSLTSPSMTATLELHLTRRAAIKALELLTRSSMCACND